MPLLGKPKNHPLTHPPRHDRAHGPVLERTVAVSRHPGEAVMLLERPEGPSVVNAYSRTDPTGRTTHQLVTMPAQDLMDFTRTTRVAADVVHVREDGSTTTQDDRPWRPGGGRIVCQIQLKQPDPELDTTTAVVLTGKALLIRTANRSDARIVPFSEVETFHASVPGPVASSHWRYESGKWNLTRIR